MKERWKSIVGYEGLYEVSDMGRVRSLNYNHTGEAKLLSLKIRREGYYAVHLYKKGKSKEFLVHRLVVTAFIGPIPKGMVVNHLNEDKLDNRLVNLEVITQKENVNWGTGLERLAKANKFSLLGNANRAKKLVLTLADYPHSKLTFTSSVKAGEFFGYKRKDSVASFISAARKLGQNWINIRKTKYYFSQET